MTGKILLEVICGSAMDCSRAELAGADRIELCAAIEVGGLTPSYGFAKSAIEGTELPIMAMVRPRTGGFCYDESEFEAMILDVETFGRLGAKGVVFGVMTSQRTVFLSRLRELVDAAGPMQTVFHRAFDAAVNPEKALEDLISAGVTRVLTSGQQATAVIGADLIKKLRSQAGDRIEIIAGSGLNAENLETFVRKTGVNQVHMSGSRRIHDGSMSQVAIAFNAPTLPEDTFRVLDYDKVEEAASVLTLIQ